MHSDNDTPLAPETAEVPVETEATTPATEETEVNSIELLEAEVAKWKEMSLRTAAEMDNLRKRSAREREESIRYANQRLLEELLPVIDNFEMGMLAAAQDQSSMIYIGMNMVHRQLNEFLIAQDVTDIPTEGVFDPNLHDAVSQEICDLGDEGRVIRVTRRGFKLRDRLLRPASVIVSKHSTPTEEGAE